MAGYCDQGGDAVPGGYAPRVSSKIVQEWVVRATPRDKSNNLQLCLYK